MVAGTTTISDPQTRLLRKLEREEVMAVLYLRQSQKDFRDQHQVSTMVGRML